MPEMSFIKYPFSKQSRSDPTNLQELKEKELSRVVVKMQVSNEKKTLMINAGSHHEKKTATKNKTGK